jgi:hypothetical protein
VAATSGTADRSVDGVFAAGLERPMTWAHAVAAADKGRQLMEIVVERLANFLVELSASKVEGKFPY